jgi:hypothetical protein
VEGLAGGAKLKDAEGAESYAARVSEGLLRYEAEIIGVLSFLARKLNPGREFLRKEMFGKLPEIPEIRVVRTWLAEFYEKKYSAIGLLTREGFPGKISGDSETNIYGDLPKKFSEVFTDIDFVEAETLDPFYPRSVYPSRDLWKEERGQKGRNRRRRGRKQEVGRGRVVIEGDPRTGKTTLCRNFARTQAWGDQFGCVILVELTELRNLKKFGISEVLKAVGVLEKFFGVIEEYSNFVVWVWEGMEDVTREEKEGGQEGAEVKEKSRSKRGSRKSEKGKDKEKSSVFRKFLDGIIEGTIPWASNSIMTRRREGEGRTSFRNARVVSPAPWGDKEIGDYVENFYRTEVQKNNLHFDVRAKNVLVQIPKPTPMMCMLVCTCLHSGISEDAEKPGIYSDIINFLLSRAANSPEVSGALQGQTEEAKATALVLLRDKAMTSLHLLVSQSASREPLLARASSSSLLSHVPLVPTSPKILRVPSHSVLLRKRTSSTLSLPPPREPEDTPKMELDLRVNENGLPVYESDFLIFNSELVHKISAGGLDGTRGGAGAGADFFGPRPVTCGFIHGSFADYLVALDLCSDLEKKLKEHVTLAYEERGALLFLASMLREDRGGSGWKKFTKFLARKFLENFAKMEAQIVAGLGDGSSRSWMTRLAWRRATGMDLCVELVSFLDEGGKREGKSGKEEGGLEKAEATELWMNTLIPKSLRVSAKLAPGALQRSAAPTRYRLMAEPAAEFGNLHMLKRLFMNCGISSEECHVAHVAASVHKKGSRVSELLETNGAAPVTLQLCCQVNWRGRRG